MILSQWYAVLESNEVRAGKPVGVTRLGEPMVFWRDAAGRVACAVDRCPHRGAALSPGAVVNGHVQCAFHGFEFDSSGQCVLIPANGRNADVPRIFQVRAFPTREAHGFIWVWTGEPRPEGDYPPLRYFPDIDDSFSYGTYRARWHAHYSRAIENQLDVVHLPFIHRRTIGRGGKTLVNGPASFCDCTDGVLRVWVYNAQDEGQAPRKPGDFSAPPEEPYRLKFIYPNIWENRISDDLRVMIAFAPIDDENTLLYLRFYQRFMKVPGLRHAINWFGAQMNNIVASEDRSIVETQRPYRTDLRMGEKLIPGDAPIIMYRRQREELIRAAVTPAREEA
ncbi:MAG: aromatic ring-hydroxylating dioxygenase subunit alpha [Anaerolineae bacterium]|nr:aromatic ring-hydroxylating dioxygenase subunit alpha [Anaerolineae bacterium]